MHRRDISKALFAVTTVSGAAALAQKAEAQTCTSPCYAPTDAEKTAGVTPTNTAYSASNGVDVRRYMSAAQLADFNKVNYDTCVINTSTCPTGAPPPSVDQSSALITAISVCSATTNWAPLIIPGQIYIASTVLINRPVNKMTSEFLIQGAGPMAGFYTGTGMTIFDSQISGQPSTGISEFITFKDIRFESPPTTTASYVMTEAFLRVKFVNCFFMCIACLNATTFYAQTWHFISCNIRYTIGPFVYATGCYDISFIDCIIEGGNTVLKVDNFGNPGRGASGVRLIDNLIEGLQTSTLALTGVSGLCIVGNHIESNPAADINLFAGVSELTNHSVAIVGNYVFNPNGAWIYYGPTKTVVSSGNTVTMGSSTTSNAGLLHSNAAQVASLTSIGDYADGGVADITLATTLGQNVQTNGSVGRQRYALPYSSGIWPNLANGNIQVITATDENSFSVQNPINAVAGQQMTLIIRNASNGSLGAIYWGSAYKMSAFTSPASGFSRTIEFEYDGTYWVQTFMATADVPN